MKTPHALLLGFALIAAAIVIAGRADHATAQADTRGTYAISTGTGGAVAIINTADGNAWRCMAADFTCKRLSLEK